METLATSLAAMHGKRIYFDTNVFIYFLKRDTDYFAMCRPFFQAVEDGTVIGVSGELVIAELLVKPLGENDIIGAETVRTLFSSDGFFTALPHNREIFEFAAHIRATQHLSMIDAVHVATAFKSGCSHIITNDEQMVERARGIQVVHLGA